MDFNSDPKVPFPGVLDIGQFHSPHADEALQIGGLFIKVSFHIGSGYEAMRVQHFPDFNLESIFVTKNIFIMKNRKKGGNRCRSVPAQLSSW